MVAKIGLVGMIMAAKVIWGNNFSKFSAKIGLAGSILVETDKVSMYSKRPAVMAPRRLHPVRRVRPTILLKSLTPRDKISPLH